MKITPLRYYQDDSPLNRKVIVRLIESEKNGRLQNSRLLEADDGTTAVETLRREIAEGRRVDFVLMDYVMVRSVYVCMYEVLCMLYMMLFQIRMNGLEAASIMRKELHYTGAIIGMLLGSLLGHHTYQIMSM